MKVNNVILKNKYLENIYSRCKKDGYFTKYETFKAFSEYFTDETTFKKLWLFLNEKKYNVSDFDQFYQKILGEKPLNVEKNNQNKVLFNNLPASAYGELSIQDDSLRKFPDIVKFGKIAYGTLELPLMIPIYDQKGLLLIVENDEHKLTANKSIELIAFRLLCSLPNGKCNFFIIDPEKSGQSFSNLFGLDARILEKEIWDDDHEITEGLRKIKNEIPKIQSEILTTKYKDLIEYNEKVKHSNKPFQFLLIAGFPNGFNSSAIELLHGIISNGSKSGIYVIMSFDINKNFSSISKFASDDFRNLTIEYDFSNNKLLNIQDSDLFNEQFYIKSIDYELPYDLEYLKNHLNSALDKVQQISIDAIDQAEFWTKNSAHGITIPIGLSVNNKVLNLQLGDGKDVHHVLIGGATGKGKTILLHDIIINTSRLYSPDELQFILMDYKEGTEFNLYSELPHLKVLTITGEVEFGLSVFEYLIDLISTRGSLFKEAGVTDFASYKALNKNSMPRIVVIMDEFQVLLDPKNKFSSKISTMLEDVTRRGRSFGINLILSTQSLGEVDISSSTLGQLGVRIAFSMPEYDCYKILHVDNVIPSEFTKAGQAVYNTSQGKKDGNLLFQASYVEKAKLTDIIKSLPSYDKQIKSIVFDGKHDIKIEDNLLLWDQIKNQALPANDLYADVFIGEPFYLSDRHAFVRIRKQQESNVLILGDDPGGAISIAYQTIYQMLLQSKPGSKVFLFDLFSVDSGWLGKFRFNDSFIDNFHNISIFTKSKSLDEILTMIKIELENRAEDESIKDRILLCIMNANSIRDLRFVGYEMSPLATKLQSILKDGPDYGVHSLIHFLNKKSFDDVFERSIYKEFENKLLLKGLNPVEFDATLDDTVKNEYSCYAIHPKSKYDADKLKIYKP